MNKNWIDDADSWICPVCGFETNNPARLNDCKCPECGFMQRPQSLTYSSYDVNLQHDLRHRRFSNIMKRIRDGKNMSKEGDKEVLSVITSNESLDRDSIKDAMRQQAVNHPSHYTFGNIEVIDAVTDWKLDFCRGNVIKYVARAGKKDDELQDLEKAEFYLKRAIEDLKKKRSAVVDSATHVHC